MATGGLGNFFSNPSVRRRGFQLWLFVVLAWSIARTILISHIFRKYGLNVTLYFAIDFLSSIPYAFTFAKSVSCFLAHQRNSALKWGLVTTLLFYLPDIYIVLDARHVPFHTYIGFGFTLIFLSILAIGQWRDRRRGL
jgi:hypothetical protein